MIFPKAILSWFITDVHLVEMGISQFRNSNGLAGDLIIEYDLLYGFSDVD